LERVARGFVDFMAVQAAGILALASINLRSSSPPSEATLSHFYLHHFLPISLVFPVVHSFFGLYTKLRGYTLEYKLRLAASSASVGTLLVLFVSFVTNSSQIPRRAALVFGFLAVLATVGVRWLKDWLFHRESNETAEPVRVTITSPDREVDLVVGGAGYIGSIVTAKLLERGRRVRLLDNLLYGKQAVEPLLSHPRLEFTHGDCRNIQDVVRAMSNVKNVVHLAAIVGDPACAQNDEMALQINYAATRMMLEVAEGHGIERFIFASSCSVYGASDDLMDEKSETVPISLYAETKLSSERVLLEAKSASFHPTILRFATVFGLAPRPRFDLVVNLLTAKAIQEGVITIYNGDQWRPFIHATDVGRAVVMALDAPLEAVSGEIFNVGDESMNFTLQQVAEKIRGLIPNIRVEFVENADRRNYRVSFRKIRGCIGFTSQRGVEDGILEIKEAYERGDIVDYRRAFYSNVSFLKERGQVHAKSDLDVKVMAAFAGAGSRTVTRMAPLPRPAPLLAPVRLEADPSTTQHSVS
jgi:nucleoside-diphosphate-sugar epimerase